MAPAFDLDERVLAAFDRCPLDHGMHAQVAVMQVLRDPPSSPIRRRAVADALARLCTAGHLQAIRAGDGTTYFKRRRWTPGFKGFEAYRRYVDGGGPQR
jgi:hypothetical protein